MQLTHSGKLQKHPASSRVTPFSQEGCDVIEESLVTSSFLLISASFGNADHVIIKICIDKNKDQFLHTNEQEKWLSINPFIDGCLLCHICFPLLVSRDFNPSSLQVSLFSERFLKQGYHYSDFLHLHSHCSVSDRLWEHHRRSL